MALIALKVYVTPETRRRIRVRVAQSDDETMTMGKYLTSLIDADWLNAPADSGEKENDNGGEAA